MFPLGQPLLPGAGTSLHVFEPRYVEMVRDLLASGADTLDFGVTMIERGHEVGGGDVRADVGALCRIAEIQALPDDRYAMIVVGVERIEIVEWLDDDPYPRADVTAWPDDPDDLPPEVLERRVTRVLEAGVSLNAALRELGHEGVPDLELTDSASDTLYAIAAQTPLGPVDRHRVLAAPSVAARCDVLEQAIEDARAVLEFHRS